MKYTTIIKKINEYLAGHKLLYLDCYVGITNDAERRLFDEHNVDKNGIWIYCHGDSAKVARDAEQYFLDQGCQGGPGGGDDDSTIVYCYKITSTTDE